MVNNTNNSPLRNKIARNALKRSKSFSRSQIVAATGASTRHTTRVLSELVSNGSLIRETNNTYVVA